MDGFFKHSRNLLQQTARDKRLTAADRQILDAAMLNTRNPGEPVGLGIDFLIRGTGLDRSTVIRSRRHLVSFGYLVPGDRGLHGLFCFTVATGGADATPETGSTGGADATCGVDATGGVEATGSGGVDATGSGGVDATQMKQGNVETTTLSHSDEKPPSSSAAKFEKAVPPKLELKPPPPESEKAPKTPKAITEREQAAARIDSLYRQNIPNEHNRKFGPTASRKRIAGILKSGRTEDELSRSVLAYAKSVGNYPVGIRRFFSKQQGDMWEGYLAEPENQISGSTMANLEYLDHWRGEFHQKYGPEWGERFEARARELGDVDKAKYEILALAQKELQSCTATA